MKRLEAGYTGFFQAEYEAVLRTASLVLGDAAAAEDVTQEAFLRLLRHWKKVSRYDRPDAWVRRVAFNLAIGVARKRRRHEELSDEITALTKEWDFGDPELSAAIAGLPPAQRAAVVLFYFEDRPVIEVADILDCSHSTARVHLHKARKALAKALGGVMASVV